jgi:hypothetical protein
MCVANKELMQKSSQTAGSSEEFFSVSTIAVNPDRIDEVLLSSLWHHGKKIFLYIDRKQAYECLAEVAEATMKEEGAKIYRFYKTEGKDEFVCMEK